MNEIVENEWVYGACFHDWTMLRYREAETGWGEALLDQARQRDVDIVTYTDYYHGVCRESGTAGKRKEGCGKCRLARHHRS